MKTLELQRIMKQGGDDGAGLILQDVNIETRSGEFLCLTGPSGSGKSMLLRIMAGLEAPTSGHVVNRPGHTGFVFQDFGLMPWLTVAENIAYGLRVAGEHPKAARRTVAEQVQLLSLNGLESCYPKELTGTQKQRAGIARALAVNPGVLLLDEPFASLNDRDVPKLRADLGHICLNWGRTVVMTTNAPAEAVQLADRILVLSPRPGTVIKSFANKLPRPRDPRSPEFYKLTDTLETFIAS